MVLWSCNRDSGELDKKELAIYSQVMNHLAWQFDNMCSDPDQLATTIPSKADADSARSFLKAQAEKRSLYYLPKIGTMRDTAYLEDWFAVEASAWDRFYSTFPGKTAKELGAALAVTSDVQAGDFHLDYLTISKLDTASFKNRDSSMTVIGFSKPFFGKERNRAVLYFELVCGHRNARGELLIVRLRDDKWEIEERRKVWINKNLSR